jgi:hypothetical protein
LELDKQVGDYAAAIMRDVDLLLADVANLNEEQQEFVNAIKNSTLRFLSLYNKYLADFVELTDESHSLAFDLRGPLSIVDGYGELLGTEEFGALSETQRQLVQQIITSMKSISNALAAWINSGREAGDQPT